MAQQVRIKCTGTDNQGEPFEAFAMITVDPPDAPGTDLPRILSLVADDTTLAPGASTNITVTGLNYTRVIWDGDNRLTQPDPDVPEEQTFTAPFRVQVGTTYVVMVTLTNDHGSNSRSIQITINNIAPVISRLDDIPQAPNFVTVGHSFRARAFATDENGDDLRYSWNAEDFTQSEGDLPSERAFLAPSTITGSSDAQKTITCTVHDVVPSPHSSLPVSRSQDVIIAPGKPGTPTIKNVNVTQTEIYFEWDPPTNNGGSPITAYRVWIRIGDSDDFTRSATIDADADLDYTYDDLAPGTIHAIAVEALNTFTIGGNNYGQTSDRATMMVTTDPVFTPPGPTEPNNSSPVLTLLIPTSTDVEVPFDLLNETVIPIEVEYSDPDGDAVEIMWVARRFGAIVGELIIDPQPHPGEGIATAQYVVPSGANRFLVFIECVGVDGRSGARTEVEITIYSVS